MWKEVVAVKRLFREVSSTTKMDLSKIRCEIVGATREASGACSGVLVQTKNSLKLDVSSTNIFFQLFLKLFLKFILGILTSAT